MEPQLKSAAGERWPERDLEVLEACPVCGAAGRTLVHRSLRDKLFHSCDQGWNLYACSTCGTHYLDPRPDRGSIGRAYASYLTHELPPMPGQAGPTRSVVDRTKGVLRALANGYRNARWGTRLEPQLRVGRHLVPCVPLLRDALVQQFRNLPARPVRPDARLLDVGCGNGAFLQFARSAGWSVQGMDFDDAAVAAARRSGLDVQRGGLELLQAAAAESFDWISLSHVLEHVHEPLAWLRELHRLVRPGGTLWLQTPNVSSLGHARYGENWRGLEPPRHLTLWTLDTLRDRLQQAGFRSVRPLRTPVLTALEVYANSEALARGLDHAAFSALPATQRRRLRHLPLALRQHASLRRSEFLTVVVTR